MGALIGYSCSGLGNMAFLPTLSPILYQLEFRDYMEPLVVL